MADNAALEINNDIIQSCLPGKVDTEDVLAINSPVDTVTKGKISKRQAETNEKITLPIRTTWNGTSLDHSPVTVSLEGATGHILLHVEAPFFGDPAPPSTPGEPLWKLWDYEVVEAFFLNDDNQYLEVEVGPYGQHLVLLLFNKRNIIRHSLPLEVSTNIKGAMWTATAKIPLDYFPPHVTKMNAYAMHIPGPGRHYESLYPADPKEKEPEFHALQYFWPLDLGYLSKGLNDRPQSALWTDSMNKVSRYEITTEWNSAPITHTLPATFTLEAATGGVRLNVTAEFFNDPIPEGEPEMPFNKLWKYEVVEVYFLNEAEEYLQVYVGPLGHHVALLLSGNRTLLQSSLPLQYAIKDRRVAINTSPGTWQGSAFIPSEYFPPNVTYMNAFAAHGTGDDRVYEALYPAPLDDPNYPAPDFHKLGLFKKIDFEHLVKENREYSPLWSDALETLSPAGNNGGNSRTQAPTLMVTSVLGFAVAALFTAWRLGK